MKKLLSLLIITVFTTLMMGCGSGSGNVSQEKKEVSATDTVKENSSQSQKSSKTNNVDGDLTIKMLNVGQGDAVLIQTKTQNILIDTSDTDERDKLREELDKAGVKKIDKLILSHAHADHIGGAKLVIENYDVKEVYNDGTDRGSYNVYKGYISAAKKKNIPVKTLQAGDKLNFGGKVSFEVFYPTEELRAKFAAEKDYNDTSIVGKLTFGDFSMLFTGDAEKVAENEQLNSSYKKKLKSTVLKAAHHGSKTSAGAEYMKAVSPECVVISAGDPSDPTGSGNSYGHPHNQALNSYIKNGGVDKENIFWTFENGTITITSDGKNWAVKPEQKSKWINSWLKK